MNNRLLYNMLRKDAESDKSKALLSLDILGNKGVGVGEHSTNDFYDNAKEALAALADAEDRISTLEKYFKQEEVVL